MRITTEHPTESFPAMWIYANSNQTDFERVIKVADVLLSQDYNLAHRDDTDCYIMLVHDDQHATIAQMKDDYRLAKLGATT